MYYETLKWLHITGAFLLLTGLITFIVLRKNSLDTSSWKKLAAALHGSGLLILLLAGIAMAWNVGWISHLPHWLWGKIIIWVLLAGIWSAIKRRNQFGKLLALTLILFSAAAMLATLKFGN